MTLFAPQHWIVIGTLTEIYPGIQYTSTAPSSPARVRRSNPKCEAGLQISHKSACILAQFRCSCLSVINDEATCDPVGLCCWSQPEDTLVYKLNGKTLTKVFTQPEASEQDITNLTLLSASGTSNSVKYAGVYNSYSSQAEVRLCLTVMHKAAFYMHIVYTRMFSDVDLLGGPIVWSAATDICTNTYMYSIPFTCSLHVVRMSAGQRAARGPPLIFSSIL
jgi:hypothetical protein